MTEGGLWDSSAEAALLKGQLWESPVTPWDKERLGTHLSWRTFMLDASGLDCLSFWLWLCCS